MAGDKVQISTYAFYNTPVQPPPSGVDLTSEILSLLSTGVVNNSAGKITSASAVSTAVNPGVTNFLTNGRPYDNTKPKAYLNWIVFDNQFNYISSNSGVQQAQPGASKQALVAPLQTIAKNGYLYIYVSNESQQDVYFDDLNVKHYTGPLVQEQSYYPFGLQMAGISDKALNKLSSQYKFNGGVELEEDFGVNLYSAFFRQYDPQIGRFSGIDLLSEQSIWVSTYQFALNNPILFNDPLGLKQELPRYVGNGNYQFSDGTIVGWNQVEQILKSGYREDYVNIWNASNANGSGDAGYVTGFDIGSSGGVDGFRINYSFVYQKEGVERHIGMGSLFVSFGKFEGFQSKWAQEQKDYKYRQEALDIWGVSLGTLGLAGSVTEHTMYSRITRSGTGWYYNSNRTFTIIQKGVSPLNAEANSSRALSKTLGKFTKPLGVIGTGISAYQTYDDIQNGNYKAAAVHGLDTVMGIVGFLGPIGAGIAGVYFVSRIFWGD